MISLAVLIAVAPVFHPSPTLLSLREAALLAQSSPQSQGTEPPKTKPPDDDFNLLAPEKKPDAAALARQARIQSEVNRRRTLLRLHQIGGYATLWSRTPPRESSRRPGSSRSSLPTLSRSLSGSTPPPCTRRR